MKTNVTVCLDGELVVEARLKKIKFSNFFNNALKTYLEAEEEDNQEMDLDERIISAKARLLSLENEKKKKKEEEEKNKPKRIIERYDKDGTRVY